MKADTSSLIASIVSGVSPIEPATPVLSNRTTGPVDPETIRDQGTPVIHPGSEVRNEQ